MLSWLQPGSMVSAAALAEFHGVSTSYLLKHLQAMSGARLLAAMPVPKGGYRGARAPEEITLLDIVLAVEGPEPAFRCNEIRLRGPNSLRLQTWRTLHDQCRNAQGRAGLSRRAQARNCRQHHGRLEIHRP